MKNPTLLLLPCLVLTLLCFPALARALPSEGACTVTVTMTNQNDQMLRETFDVASDVSDPAGGPLRGQAPGYSFARSALGHPVCHYAFGPKGEMPMTLDVYAIPGEPMYVHLFCPHCFVRTGEKKAISVSAANKQMAYDPKADVPTFPGWTQKEMAHNFPSGAGGLISIERFRCPWEMDPTAAVAQGRSSNPMCDFDVIIENNVARRPTHSDPPIRTS